MNEPIPTVVPIQLGPVTVYAVRGERTVLIDTGAPGTAGALRQALDAAGIKPSDISLIVISHGHSDHFGSLHEVRTLLQAPVAVHAADADHVCQGVNPPIEPSGWAARMWVRRLGLEQHQLTSCEPDLVFDYDLDLLPYGVNGRVIQTPGHTPGSVSVALADGTVIVGDLVMGGILRRGSPSYPFVVANRAQISDSIRTVLKMASARIYAAHGGPFTPESIHKQFPWIGAR